MEKHCLAIFTRDELESMLQLFAAYPHHTPTEKVRIPSSVTNSIIYLDAGLQQLLIETLEIQLAKIKNYPDSTDLHR